MYRLIEIALTTLCLVSCQSVSLVSGIESIPGTYDGIEVPDADSQLAEGFAYELTETKSDYNRASDAKRREAWPVRMYGNGGRGKIVGADGNIVDQSGDKHYIFGCEVSPDSERIIIYRGSVDYDVMNLKTKDVTTLPAHPPGKNMMGFNSWDWVNDDMLVGVSYRVVPFRDDQVGLACEDPILDRSVIYTYKLSDQELRRVRLPSHVEERIVSVELVDDVGNVLLFSDTGMIPRDTGGMAWFAIQSKE